MLEFEKKALLSKTEYEALLQLQNKPDTAFVQTNYYYDTDDLAMDRSGITCRIRERDGQYKATVKKHRTNERECSTENSKTVINAYDNSLFKGMDTHLQGALTTCRTILCAEEGLEAALDKNTYLGITDYELEIEYALEKSDRAERLLHQFADALCALNEETDATAFCMRTKHAKSKSERFFARKQCIQAQGGE